MKYICPSCNANNNKYSIFCANCNEKIITDEAFYTKIKKSAFFATVLGIVGFEFFYILSYYLPVNADKNNGYIFYSMIIPLIGIAGSLFYLRYRLLSGLIMLFIGFMHIFLEIFLISSIYIFINDFSNSILTLLIIFTVTLPNLLCGIIFIKNAYSAINRAIGTAKNMDFRLHIAITILMSAFITTASFVLILSLIF